MVKIIVPDSVKKYMDLQCNGRLSDYTDCLEFQSISNLFSLSIPKNVVDLGSGIGRASVYLRNQYSWSDTNFYLVDGNTGDKQIAGLHQKVSNHFYNSFLATKSFCLANNISTEHLYLIDASKRMAFVKHQFDFCYSLKAIGFHWPILEYLNRLYQYMKPGAYFIFELRSIFPGVYPKERIRRISLFNEQQIFSVDTTKYEMNPVDTSCRFPLLVLRVR